MKAHTARGRARRFVPAGLLLALSMLVTPGAGAGEPCGSELDGWRAMTPATIELVDDRGRALFLEARIADDHDERAAGYQHVCPEVIARTAILFVFRKPLSGRFHMQNVYAPLDIAFFDGTGLMVDRETMRPEPPGFPGQPSYYGSRLPYLYALEIPAGFLDAHRLSPGKARLLLESLP